MRALVYRCPFCSANVDVPEDHLTGPVICPNPGCGRPFELEMPKAQLVGSHDEGQPAEITPSEEVRSGDEQTIRSIHPAMFRKHPLRFLTFSGLVVLGVAGLIAGGANFTQLPSQVGIVALVAGAGALAWWWLQTQFVTLTVTDKRSILQTGLIARRTSEVRHDDVRNLQIDQTLMERLLGVGDLAISSAGQADLEIFVKGVPQPNLIAELIRDRQA